MPLSRAIGSAALAALLFAGPAAALRCAQPDVAADAERHASEDGALMAVGTFRGLQSLPGGDYRGEFTHQDGKVETAFVEALNMRRPVAGAPDLARLVAEIEGQERLFFLEEGQSGALVFSPGLCPYQKMHRWTAATRAALKTCTAAICRGL